MFSELPVSLGEVQAIALHRHRIVSQRQKGLSFGTEVICKNETEREQTTNWRKSSKHLMALNVLISGQIMHGIARQ